LSAFSARYFKTDAARISKPDIEMFHHESWKPIYFGVKKVKGQVHEAQKVSVSVGFCTLLIDRLPASSDN